MRLRRGDELTPMSPVVIGYHGVDAPEWVPTTMPRVTCWKCGQDTAVQANGKLVWHLATEQKRYPWRDRCGGCSGPILCWLKSAAQ